MKKRIISLLLLLLMIIPALGVQSLGGPKDNEIDAFPFDDVPQGSWYEEAVVYVTDRAFMNGMGGRVFAPLSNLTRAMFAQILFNLSKESAAGLPDPGFTDVKANSWYYGAVCWAKYRGVVSGISETKFAPDNKITREQIAAMFIRFSAAMKYTDPSAKGGKFTDDKKISSWAYDAVYKAKEAGYISGRPGNIFDPKANATRAEAAQMIMNYDKNFLKIRLAKETVIPVKGITKEYTLLHVTDTHTTAYDDELDSEYAEYCMNRRNLFLSETVGPYDANQRFPDFFKYAKQIDADEVILTGDNIDCPTYGNFALLDRAIVKGGWQDKTAYCFGNHDWNFCDESERDAKIADIKSRFSIFFNGEDDCDVKVYEREEYRIISVANDNYQVSYKAVDALRDYAFLDDGKPVILMLHVPLFTEDLASPCLEKWHHIITMGEVTDAEKYEQYQTPTNATKQFVSFVENYENNIVLVTAGHVHFDCVTSLPTCGIPEVVTGGGYDGTARTVKLVPAE